MTEEDKDILEFLISSDFNSVNYSEDQYVYFLKKYKEFYRLLNAQYHGLKAENERLIIKSQEDDNQLLMTKRSNIIDKAKVNTMNKELKKKLTFKERILGKLINRFNPDNI